LAGPGLSWSAMSEVGPGGDHAAHDDT
jgi:hypothetical protein